VTGVDDRPEYAPDSSDEEEEEEIEFSLSKQQPVLKDAESDVKLEASRDDRRLRRLHDRQQQQQEVDSDDDRETRSALSNVCLLLSFCPALYEFVLSVLRVLCIVFRCVLYCL